MSVFKLTPLNVLLFSYLFSVSNVVHAGAYIFAGEANGVDLIVHPQNYTGAEDVVTIRVCIDPTSQNASEMVHPVQNIVDTYNQMLATNANLKIGDNNNVPTNTFDFESVALHEVGHCLGMAHTNIASESGLLGDDRNYTKSTDGTNNVFDVNAGVDGVRGSSDDVRGDDENLVWFRTLNNDPFTIDSVVDSTTYSRDLADLPTGHLYAANAGRAVSASLNHPSTEAVMQQGTYSDEAQRTLGHDDVATLRYAMSGLNERESGGPGNNNANDNYTIVLEYAGISTANCDVSMSITAEAMGFAACFVGGAGLQDHAKITTANIEFDDSYNWFFNAPNTAPVLNSIADISLLAGDNLVVNIAATDIDANTLSFSVSGEPSFATLVDNNDGTATLTIAPPIGEDSLTSVTVTVTDNGSPVLSANETFAIDVSLDSDGDGLSDDDEVNIYGTSPNNSDSDSDGLSDYEEVILYGTLPNDADSDNDFINDFDEINNGGDPLDDASWPNFSDGDIAPLGAPDGLTNAADYVIAQRILLGDITATSLELSHADLYPAGSPDGIINASDLILLIQLIQQ